MGVIVIEMREHQLDAIDKLRRSVASGNRRPILFAPCSFGKTMCAAHLAKLSIDKGGKFLFIVHRRMLAEQTKREFDKYGLHSSIIMSGYDTDFTAPAMITTRQTYSRRIELAEPRYNSFFHDADLICIDECHLGISEQYQKIYSYYEGKVIIGLTGSPARSDQRGLGSFFDDLVQSVGVQQLTDMGYLAPARYFAPTKIDLSGIKITAGDYNKKQLQERMNTTTLNGDIIQNYLKIAPERQGIVFTTGVKHSINLARGFNAAGIPAYHLDAHSPDEERISAMQRFKDGEIQVITNCQLFTEGLSADWVSCIVLAFGTKSWPKYIQCVGRGQRIYPGKQDFIVLDHGNNIERFGFISDDVEWVLSDKEIAWKKPKKREKKQSKPIECEMCGRVFNPAPKCPDCFHPVTSYGRKIETTDDDLIEVGKNRKNASPKEKMKWYRMFLFHARVKGMKDGWAYWKCKEKFGSSPRSTRGVQPIAPDAEVQRYIKYLNIKYAKSKQKEAANAA